MQCGDLKFNGNLTDQKRVVSCHKHNLKWLNFDYIYRICYKNAKKANPRKMICPI